MSPDDFIALRKLKGKQILTDIEFVQHKDLSPHVVAFDDAEVDNSMGLGVVASGQYNRKTGRTTFCFTLEGRGQICRVCVNGAIHGDAGRTHKHELRDEADIGELPHAVPRPDLAGKTPKEIWEIICRNARIDHVGNFTDPSGE